jgi:hypothetical protein
MIFVLDIPPGLDGCLVCVLLVVYYRIKGHYGVVYVNNPGENWSGQSCGHMRSGIVQSLLDNGSAEFPGEQFGKYLVCLDCGKKLEFNPSICVPDIFLSSLNIDSHE